MADRTDDPRIGKVIAGYRIEERVGRGGMGVVYRAEHLNLRRRAAIKIIAPDLAESEGFRERFTREARIAAALQHPNIVTVYDAGEVDGILYLAMQYIEGRTAFLTDFGLTKRTDGTHTELTRAGDVVGTIHYVAPEQIEGGQVSTRSDVYSLGCLIYHCITGQVPYSRETDVAVIYAHLSEPPPKLTALRPELAAGLDGVIATAGPLDTSAPRTQRESSVIGSDGNHEVGEAIEGMRDAAAAARRPRV